MIGSILFFSFGIFIAYIGFFNVKKDVTIGELHFIKAPIDTILCNSIYIYKLGHWPFRNIDGINSIMTPITATY
jgi:hypothetical protein